MTGESYDTECEADSTDTTMNCMNESDDLVSVTFPVQALRDYG